MTFYRCYFLDEARRIRDVEAVECTDDRAAARRGAELLAAKSRDRRTALSYVEIWDADRLVDIQPPPQVA